MANLQDIIGSFRDGFKLFKHDKIFEKEIEKEFLHELILISKIIGKDEIDRSQEENYFIEMMREKYVPGSGCPSCLYRNSSRHLRNEYDRVHRQICDVLYNRELVADE